jgi:HAMP domain-containing protein
MGNEESSRGSGSLTTSLTLTFFLLCAIILFGVVGLETYFQYRMQANVVSADQQTIARNAANTVEGFVQDKFSVLAITTNLSGFATANPNDQQLTLERLLGEISSFRQLALFDAQGHEKSKVTRLSSFEPSQMEKAVEGNLTTVVQGGSNYVSPIYIDNNTNEPLTTIVFPLKDIYGGSQGALAAEVNLKFMWDLMGSIHVGDGGQAYVVDKKGNLIACDDISRILAGENLATVAEVAKYVKGQADEGISVSKGFLGTQVVTSHVSLGSPSWAVVVELPIAEAYKPLADSIKMSLLTVLLGLILVICVSVYLSTVITRPLIKLRDATLAINRGDWQTKIEVTAQNEIGELASAFNEMTAQLGQSYTGLEKKVAERTKELESSKQLLESNMDEIKRTNNLMVGREIKMAELKTEINELRVKLNQTSSNQKDSNQAS